MSKVYVVTQGCYSDYRISAIFSNKEDAEKYYNKYKSDSYSGLNEYIEEYDLDSIDLNAPTKWHVSMLENGDVDYCRVQTPDYEGDDKYNIYWSYRGSHKRMDITVTAKDKKHAIKIANERRAIAKANGEWDIPKPNRRQYMKVLKTDNVEVIKDSAVYVEIKDKIEDYVPSFSGVEEGREDYAKDS